MGLTRSAIFAYGSAGFALVGFLVIVLTKSMDVFGIIAAIFAGGGALFAVLFYRYGYILVPLITQQSRIVVMTETGYEIPPTQDMIIKKSESGVYYATMFLGIRIYESASEKTLEENIAYNKFYERAISNLKFITKISYLLYVEDVTNKKKILETKRAEAQLRLSRERDKVDKDVLKLDRYEREIAKWELELVKLRRGLKPMGTIAYAMTTATGITKESAMAIVKNQANEIKAVLTNALNIEIDVLTADEMLRAFEWEKMLPITIQEIEDEMI